MSSSQRSKTAAGGGGGGAAKKRRPAPTPPAPTRPFGGGSAAAAASAAAHGLAPKRRPLPGLAPPGFSGAYTGVTPMPVISHAKTIEPVDNLAGSSTIVFRLKTAWNELIR
jgi:hypothetical protein